MCVGWWQGHGGGGGSIYANGHGSTNVTVMHSSFSNTSAVVQVRMCYVSGSMVCDGAVLWRGFGGVNGCGGAYRGVCGGGEGH